VTRDEGSKNILNIRQVVDVVSREQVLSVLFPCHFWKGFGVVPDDYFLVVPKNGPLRAPGYHRCSGQVPTLFTALHSGIRVPEVHRGLNLSCARGEGLFFPSCLTLEAGASHPSASPVRHQQAQFAQCDKITNALGDVPLHAVEWCGVSAGHIALALMGRFFETKSQPHD